MCPVKCLVRLLHDTEDIHGFNPNMQNQQRSSNNLMVILGA